MSQLRVVLESGGPVTTMATLVTALGLSGEVDEKRLREHLYYLRIEGMVDFERPLGRFAVIRRSPPGSS